MKSTVDQIRERFDKDVERFSNLETGQSATIDAPLVLDLISEAAALMTPQVTSLLDVGCGAGNFTLKLLERLPDRNVTLVDLSAPMLERARDRVAEATRGRISTIQGDIREVSLEAGAFDVIVAAAVLHHLREDEEWEAVFRKFYGALKPGGSLWIADLTTHSIPILHDMMWRRFGEYLVSLKGEPYRDHVFAYIEQEDTPRPLLYQVDLLRQTGFHDVEILHKNNCFAAFGALK